MMWTPSAPYSPCIPIWNSLFPFFPIPLTYPISTDLFSLGISSFFFFFGLTLRLVGSQFPDQGLNPCPLHWKCGVLTTGSPGNSLGISSLNKTSPSLCSHVALLMVHFQGILNFWLAFSKLQLMFSHVFIPLLLVSLPRDSTLCRARTVFSFLAIIFSLMRHLLNNLMGSFLLDSGFPYNAEVQIHNERALSTQLHGLVSAVTQPSFSDSFKPPL